MQFDPPFLPLSRLRSDVGRPYRLYFLDGAGHITRSHEYLAADDSAAIKVAEGWREGRAMELWSRDRKVKVWP